VRTSGLASISADSPYCTLLVLPPVAPSVLESPRPPRRVPAGKAGERAGLLAERLQPFRAFEAAARGSLGVWQPPGWGDCAPALSRETIGAVTG